MPILEPIAPNNAADFKSVRLRALQDAPSAFGSTYARESKLSDAEWLQRAASWNGERSVGYLAKDQGVVWGIVAAYLDEHNPLQVHVISMWVAPEYRRTGLGRTLIEAIQTWAMQRGTRELRLIVTSCNRTAIDFYNRLGFTMTGKVEPYPNNPALVEYEMLRPVNAK